MGGPAARGVAVTGATGYLGQFVVPALAQAGWQVTALYHEVDGVPPPAWPADQGVAVYGVDMRTGAGLERALAAAAPLAAVVNCAAISSPAACAADPGAAAATNVPSALLDALDGVAVAQGSAPLLVQLSTDQVYAGTRPHWREDDRPCPVNVYGKTKLAAERAIQGRWDHHLILRSSAMVGPPAPTLALPKVPFLQFVRAAVRGDAPGASFYTDEWRSFVAVTDVASVIVAEIGARPPAAPAPPGPPRAAAPGPPAPRARVVNLGGPARLSRADFARVVAGAEGLGEGAVAVSSRPAAGAGAAVSPQDISMDVSRLRSLGFEPKSVEQLVAEVVKGREAGPEAVKGREAGPEAVKGREAVAGVVDGREAGGGVEGVSRH